MSLKDPAEALAALQSYIRPEASSSDGHPVPWTMPEFETYEAMKDWLKEKVLSARVYERYPDGRWTVELLLKEQEPDRPRLIVL